MRFANLVALRSCQLNIPWSLVPSIFKWTDLYFAPHKAMSFRKTHSAWREIDLKIYGIAACPKIERSHDLTPQPAKASGSVEV